MFVGLFIQADIASLNAAALGCKRVELVKRASAISDPKLSEANIRQLAIEFLLCYLT